MPPHPPLFILYLNIYHGAWITGSTCLFALHLPPGRRYTCIYICVHTYTHTHTCTLTHAHTHTQDLKDHFRACGDVIYTDVDRHGGVSFFNVVFFRVLGLAGFFLRQIFLYACFFPCLGLAGFFLRHLKGVSSDTNKHTHTHTLPPPHTHHTVCVVHSGVCEMASRRPHVYTPTHLHIHTQTCMYICLSVCMYTHTHTHVHTRTTPCIGDDGVYVAR